MTIKAWDLLLKRFLKFFYFCKKNFSFLNSITLLEFSLTCRIIFLIILLQVALFIGLPGEYFNRGINFIGTVTVSRLLFLALVEVVRSDSIIIGSYFAEISLNEACLIEFIDWTVKNSENWHNGVWNDRKLFFRILIISSLVYVLTLVMGVNIEYFVTTWVPARLVIQYFILFFCILANRRGVRSALRGRVGDKYWLRKSKQFVKFPGVDNSITFFQLFRTVCLPSRMSGRLFVNLFGFRLA